MKWFSFLKSRTGKLTLNVQSAFVLAAGVGILGVSLAHNLAEQTSKQELAARSLSSISNAYNYGGLRQTKEGLSSMNMANLSGGLDGIASAEERARFEAARTGNGQFGLDAADNMGRNVASAMSGSAAEMSDTEGLGMGKNAVVMQNNASGSSTANMPQVAPGTVAQQGQNARNARGASNTLAPASARTSGGSGVSNSGFGGSSSSGANRSGSSSYSGSSARGEGYRLSGAMPGGTNPVSMRGEGGRNSSGFGAGRNASVGQSGRFKSTGNDLKDISRQSAKIAANSHRSTTGGAEPFLAAGRVTAGMSFDNSVEETTTGSSDLEMKNLPKQQQALQTWQEKTDLTEEQRAKDRNTLLWWMAGVLGSLVLVVPLACWFMGAAKTPWTSWMAAIGYALLVCVALAITHMLRVAWLFRKTWDAPTLPTICDVFGAMGYALVTLAAIPGTRSIITENIGKVWKFLLQQGISLGSSFGLGKLQQTIFSKK